MNYIESEDLDFSPLFTSDRFTSYYIEKSELYERIGSKTVSSVEFIVIEKENFYFIEAKSSFPYSKVEDVKVAEQKIYDKLHHSIDLFASKKLGLKKFVTGDLAKELGSTAVFEKDLANCDLYFYLVMHRKFREDWIENVQIMLNDKLKPLRKIWNIEVKVVTESQARDLKFIQ